MNRNTSYDCATLEMRLKHIKDDLNQRKDLFDRNSERFMEIKEQISELEKTIEESRFLFENNKARNAERENQNFEADIDFPTFSDNEENDTKNNHSLSLLLILKNKHADITKKLKNKEKELKMLQKETGYTDLNELFSDINELKMEIERVENSSDKIYKRIYSNFNLKMMKPMYESGAKNNIFTVNNDNKSEIMFCKDKSDKKNKETELDEISEQDLENSVNSSVRSSKVINSRSRSRNRSKSKYSSQKKMERLMALKKQQKIDEEYEKKRIFLLNHLIIQQLHIDNKKMYKNLEYTTGENLKLQKLNSTVEENIIIKKNSLQKIEDEKKQMTLALEMLKNQESINKFKNCERELKDQLE